MSEVQQDRSADRNAIQAQMDDYARQGGLVSKLDWAGNLVALESEKPSGRPTAKVLPMPTRPPKPAPVKGFIELDDRPVVPLTPVEVIPEPQVRLRAKILPLKAPIASDPKPNAFKAPAPASVIVELRHIRENARRALARLDAAFPATVGGAQ